MKYGPRLPRPTHCVSAGCQVDLCRVRILHSFITACYRCIGTGRRSAAVVPSALFVSDLEKWVLSSSSPQQSAELELALSVYSSIPLHFLPECIPASFRLLQECWALTAGVLLERSLRPQKDFSSHRDPREDSWASWFPALLLILVLFMKFRSLKVQCSLGPCTVREFCLHQLAFLTKLPYRLKDSFAAAAAAILNYFLSWKSVLVSYPCLDIRLLPFMMASPSPPNTRVICCH